VCGTTAQTTPLIENIYFQLHSQPYKIKTAVPSTPVQRHATRIFLLEGADPEAIDIIYVSISKPYDKNHAIKYIYNVAVLATTCSTFQMKSKSCNRYA
jgi:hypothetical protein